MPARIRFVMSVAALPMSIWPTAMSKPRPSSAPDFVRPVTACLVAVYGAEFGRGVSDEIDPLLTMRPPRGCCAFITRNACCMQRKVPVKFASTTVFHWS